MARRSVYLWYGMVWYGMVWYGKCLQFFFGNVGMFLLSFVKTEAKKSCSISLFFQPSVHLIPSAFINGPDVEHECSFSLTQLKKHLGFQEFITEDIC